MRVLVRFVRFGFGSIPISSVNTKARFPLAELTDENVLPMPTESVGENNNNHTRVTFRFSFGFGYPCSKMVPGFRVLKRIPTPRGYPFRVL